MRKRRACRTGCSKTRWRARCCAPASTWPVAFPTTASRRSAPSSGAARVGAAVDLDFWTEAAVLAERGIDAVVFGPGAVGQAHAADEFVDIAELEEAAATFARVLR